MTDPIVAAAEFIVQNLEWTRHQPWADEFLADIGASARVVSSTARGPAAQRYLGPCGAEREHGDLCAPGPGPCFEDDFTDECRCWCHEGEPKVCDGDIYAREHASVGRCRTCGAEVSTDARRAWLDDEVRAHAFRAVEIAQAYGVNVNTIRSWATRGSLKSYFRTEAGIVSDWADPPKGETRERLHYVGDVLDLASADAARRAEGQAKRARRAAVKADSEGAAA